MVARRSSVGTGCRGDPDSRRGGGDCQSGFGSNKDGMPVRTGWPPAATAPPADASSRGER